MDEVNIDILLFYFKMLALINVELHGCQHEGHLERHERAKERQQRHQGS